MPVFLYRAADRGGHTIDGVMEAPDARAVIERLHKESYFPVRVAPYAERKVWPSPARGGGGVTGSGVTDGKGPLLVKAVNASELEATEHVIRGLRQDSRRTRSAVFR